MGIGRPSRLTKQLADKIVKALEVGAFAKDACGAVNLGEDLFYGWIARGRGALEQTKLAKLGETDPVTGLLYTAAAASEEPFAEFALRCEAASSKAVIEALKRVRRGATGWQGSAWFLERRDREAWGRRWHIDHNTTNAPKLERPTRVEVCLVEPVANLPMVTDGIELEDDEGEPARH